MIVHLDRFWHNRGRLADCSALLWRALRLSGDTLDPELGSAGVESGRTGGHSACDGAAAIAYLAESLTMGRQARMLIWWRGHYRARLRQGARGAIWPAGWMLAARASRWRARPATPCCWESAW